MVCIHSYTSLASFSRSTCFARRRIRHMNGLSSWSLPTPYSYILSDFLDSSLWSANPSLSYLQHGFRIKSTASLSLVLLTCIYLTLPFVQSDTGFLDRLTLSPVHLPSSISSSPSQSPLNCPHHSFPYLLWSHCCSPSRIPDRFSDGIMLIAFPVCVAFPPKKIFSRVSTIQLSYRADRCLSLSIN